MMHTGYNEAPRAEWVAAFVAVSANIDPDRNIPAALRALMLFALVEASSTFYRNPPLGRPGQPMFINGVWKLRTSVPPRELKFDVLRRIEADLGRVRTEDAHAPRPIDLDLILYGDSVMDEPGLRLPDPAIRRRPFVAVPLLELAPDLRLPDSGECLSSLAVSRDVAGLEALVAFSQELERLLEQ